MWGSMPLVIMSMTIITVLHSAEVVLIPHEVRSSLIAGYPLYRRVPLRTSRPCGSQESPLPHPFIPNQADPKRVHSICTTDWYGKLGSTTYYTRPYSYRLMVVLFSWVSLYEPVLWSGYDDYHRLLESTGHSPKLSKPTERSSKPVTPNPDREQQLLTGWQ
jgi:hypothetical protein